LDRFAVIDLGSNTFHLLIVEKTTWGFKELYRKRVYTKLAMGGSRTILEESFSKGIACLQEFRNILNRFKIVNYRALGTAALRSADNGKEFISQAMDTANIKIDLIDGNQEATLIAKGVKAAIDISSHRYLIMDIGGGSVEFIILENGSVQWQQSFPIGLAILKALFHTEEPISVSELEQMKNFLDLELQPLKQQLTDGPKIKALIGASGSFEVVQAILDLSRWNQQTYKCHVLDFFKVQEMIMHKSTEERVQIKGLPIERVDLIVVALFLINYILKLTEAEEIIISDYALKEGVIAQKFDIS